MRRFREDQMTGGWFIGDFEPSVIRTAAFEACLKRHAEGEPWPTHYHLAATEVTLIISGEMTINGERFVGGDGFLVEPGEVISPVFLTDCVVMVIKTPSVPGDKYEVEPVAE